MYLLDTNVVSELRRPRPHGAVLAWIREIPSRLLYVSAVTIGEIQAGIEITRDQDPAKADLLEEWLSQVSTAYNVISMDAETFRQWARMTHRKPQKLLEDAMIAATAEVRGLIVVTRNVRDFRQFDVPTFNPFAS